MQLEMFDTINLEPDYDVNSKTRLCPKCNIHKPRNALYCKLCKKVYTDALYRLHKENTKPVDQIFCDCCNIKVKGEKFMLDHCHETNQFRGWVCRNCNTGIGNLGDNVEGLENAIRYLKRNKEHETRT